MLLINRVVLDYVLHHPNGLGNTRAIYFKKEKKIKIQENYLPFNIYPCMDSPCTLKYLDFIVGQGSQTFPHQTEYRYSWAQLHILFANGHEVTDSRHEGCQP